METIISVNIKLGKPQEKIKHLTNKFDLPYKLSVGDAVDFGWLDSLVIHVEVNLLNKDINVAVDDLIFENNDEYEEAIKILKDQGWK